MENSVLITAIYNAILFRDPSEDEKAKYIEELDRALITPTNLVFELAGESEYVANLAVSKLYKAAFGTYLPPAETMLWRSVLDSGAQIEQIANQFLNSSEFLTRIGSMGSVENILTELVQDAAGIALTATQSEYYANLIRTGELSPVETLLKITSVMSDLEIAGASVYGALNGSFEGYTVPAESDEDRLFINSIINDSLDSAGSADPVVEGAVEGSDAADLISAVDGAEYVRGFGGNDTIRLSRGADLVVFEANAADNGTDVILDFELGEGGDVLDFTRFLNSPGLTLVGNSVELGSTNAVSWANGDVIVAQGFGLDTAEGVAALFGEGLELAAPTGAAKAVLVTSDIIGDANIWFLVNQTAVSSIEAEEIVLVGTLGDVNNTSLLPFAETNFASLG